MTSAVSCFTAVLLASVLQILELDAEIKHAFAELERNQDERKDMEASNDALSRDLAKACKDLNAAQEELVQKAEESKAMVDAQQDALVSLCTLS